MRTANEIALASAVLVLAGGAAASAEGTDTDSDAGEGARSAGSEHATSPNGELPPEDSR